MYFPGNIHLPAVIQITLGHIAHCPHLQCSQEHEAENRSMQLNIIWQTKYSPKENEHHYMKVITDASYPEHEASKSIHVSGWRGWLTPSQLWSHQTDRASHHATVNSPLLLKNTTQLQIGVFKKEKYQQICIQVFHNRQD